MDKWANLRKVVRNPRLLKLSKLYVRMEARQAQGVSACRRGILRLPYPPIRVRIETTNKCNLRCVMCPTGQRGEQHDSGFMDFGLYERIINEVGAFSYPTSVVLFLGGEPLLCRDLGKMIVLAKAKGLLCRFNTNATLLTEDKIDTILKSRLDSIGFSFDDVSPEEYGAMRRNASYEKTLGNIIAFLKRKRALGLHYPLVTISSLRLRDASHSERELEVSLEFRRLFSGYEIQNIGIAWAHLWAGDFADNPLYQYKRGEVGDSRKCHMPWTDLTINWKGQVVACCNDANYDYIIGDVKQNTLLKLWNSERMVGLREVLSAGAYENIKLCRSCSAIFGEESGAVL